MEGTVNNSYDLVWTSTNTCGNSSDTVHIELTEVEMATNFVIVDTTDIISSDSTELAGGIYKIEFLEAITTINDSCLLVGIMGDGFLRKVSSFQQNNDTSFLFQTEQGYLEDICKAGVLNLGDNVLGTEAGLKSASSVTKLNRRLTRKELTTNPKFKKITPLPRDCIAW